MCSLVLPLQSRIRWLSIGRLDLYESEAYLLMLAGMIGALLFLSYLGCVESTALAFFLLREKMWLVLRSLFLVGSF